MVPKAWRGDRQYTIPVGSAHSVRPDLIIAKEGTPIFVVELKKPSSGATPRNADQLFSYMRLLKLNVGLLISDVVQLYYDDPSNADNPRLVESIPARSDCEEGPILFDLLMKDGFAKSSLNAYIAETLSQQTTLTQVQYLRSRLLSEQGATLVNEALTDFFHSEAAKDVIHDALRIYLQKEYPQEVVSQALDGLDIKWENQPRSNNSPLGQTSAREEHTNRESSYSPTKEPSLFRGKKVGQIANDHLRAMLERGNVSPEESNLWKPENTVNAFSESTTRCSFPHQAPTTARDITLPPFSLGASPINSATIGTNRPRITIGLISCHGSKATRRTYSPRDFTWGELQLPARFPVDLRRDRRDPCTGCRRRPR